MDDAGRPARTPLDDLVVSMELTLIAIIQGVALYFLVESSRGHLLDLEFEVWPYITCALLIILLWWSRATIHTLTVIGWPIAFGHNFLYVLSTFLEAVLFTQVANPARWYAASSAFAASVWLVFAYDLRLITEQHRAHAAWESRALFEHLRHDQMVNLSLWMPVTLAFYVGSAVAIRRWPGVFLTGKWHLALAALQLIGALGSLVYAVTFFRRVAPAIARAREGR